MEHEPQQPNHQIIYLYVTADGAHRAALNLSSACSGTQRYESKNRPKREDYFLL